MKLFSLLSLLLCVISSPIFAATEVSVISNKKVVHLLVKNADISGIGEAAGSITKNTKEIYELIKKEKLKAAGPARAVVGRDESTGQWTTISAVPVEVYPKKKPKGVQYQEIPVGSIAVATHKGSYKNITDTYKVLANWIKTNSKKPAGDFWEVYLNSPDTTKEDDLLTEIQVQLK